MRPALIAPTFGGCALFNASIRIIARFLPFPMGAVMSGKLVLKGDVTPFMELELF